MNRHKPILQSLWSKSIDVHPPLQIRQVLRIHAHTSNYRLAAATILLQPFLASFPARCEAFQFELSLPSGLKHLLRPQ